MDRLVARYTYKGVVFSILYTPELEDEDGEVCPGYYFWRRTDRSVTDVGACSFVPFDTVEDTCADAAREVDGTNYVTEEEVQEALISINGMLGVGETRH